MFWLIIVFVVRPPISVSTTVDAMSDKTAKRKAERFRQMQRQLTELQSHVDMLTQSTAWQSGTAWSEPSSSSASASWRWQPYDWSEQPAEPAASAGQPPPPPPPQPPHRLPAQPAQPAQPTQPKQELSGEDEVDVVLIAYGREWQDVELEKSLDAIVDAELMSERWGDYSTFACCGLNGRIVLEARLNQTTNKQTVYN